MTPGIIRKQVVTERTAWIRDMLKVIRTLPLATREEFLADPRNVAAAESFLRRAHRAS